MSISVLDVSAYLGLTAVGAVTLNLLLGTLMVFRYSPLRGWPHRKFNYFRLHKFSGYAALVMAAAHPLLLLLNKSPRFVLSDIAYPVHSPGSPLENSVGAVALYLITIVIVTSYFRIRLGRRLWKAFHFSVYFAAAALLFHSLLVNPELKSGPVDWMDGGKLFVMGCVLVISAAGLLRWRHSQKRMKHPPHELSVEPS